MHRTRPRLSAGARLLGLVASILIGCTDPASARLGDPATSAPAAGALQDPGETASAEEPVGTGLTGQYYSDQALTTYVFSRLDPTVDFDWVYDSPDPRIHGSEHFSVRWNGQVLAPATGTYTFQTIADDGVRLWVNGQPIISDWKDGVNTDTGTIDLTAGRRYDLQLDYFQGVGGDSIQLFWTPPGGESAIIPAANLFPAERACTPSCGGKACGPDGCNGTCGDCSSGETCNFIGTCVAACAPTCEGKVCGSDGCSGSCGACTPGQTCDASGRCSGAPHTLVYDPANGFTDPHPYRSFDYPPISGSRGNTTVDLNVWSSVGGMTERAYVTDPGTWQIYVSVDNPDGHVPLFTNSGQSYGEAPLADFSSILSSFDVTLPDASTGATGWNGYDIWLNGWHNEVMISTAWINAYPCPIVATATFGGSGGVPLESWGLCSYGPGYQIWQLNAMHGPDATALTVDVKAMLQWLIDHEYIATRASTLTAISFGFEVTNTHGLEVGPWGVDAFSITMK